MQGDDGGEENWKVRLDTGARATHDCVDVVEHELRVSARVPVRGLRNSGSLNARRRHVQLLDRAVTPGGSALAKGIQSIIFSRKYDKSGAPLRLLLRRCVRATRAPSSPLVLDDIVSQLCNTSGRAARGRAHREE